MQNQIGLIDVSYAFVQGTPSQALTASYANITGGTMSESYNFTYSSDTLTYTGIYTLPFQFSIYAEGSDTSNNGGSNVRILHNNTTSYGAASFPGITTGQIFSKSTSPSGIITLNSGDTINLQALAALNNVTLNRFYLVLTQITGI